VLIDDGGSEVLMSTLDLFGASSMRGKTIVLSACETAHEPVLASAEPTSIAAALLQLGASFVLGSAWVAIDTSASALCSLFHEALAANAWDPVRTFAVALRALRAAHSLPSSEWATFLPLVGASG
jgi:CHAT domain-containing protein